MRDRGIGARVLGLAVILLAVATSAGAKDGGEKAFRWEGRMCFPGLEFNGEPWIMGGIGESSTYCQDVWRSSDGIDWVQVANAAPWGYRKGDTSLVFGGKLWDIDGYGRMILNEARNSVDRANWTEATTKRARRTYAILWFAAGHGDTAP